ncbi:hypothetical protein D3C72_1612030 [compost metagenome]
MSRMTPSLADSHASLSGTLMSMASASNSTSSTCSPSRPTWSQVGARGNTPRVDNVPSVGLYPTTPHSAAGIRTEPPVSVPTPAMMAPCAIAAAAPPLDPPGMRAWSSGFSVSPNLALAVVTPHANSWVVVLPMMIAPRSTRVFTMSASAAGT